MVNFVAVDGEADADGRYVILCDSTGRTLVNTDGITTRQAFDFLISIPRDKRTRIVCFGLNYDVNQWIVGLSNGELKRLAASGATTHMGRYRITWLPRKLFILRDEENTAVYVSEVFGFFQTSFVKALRAWGIPPNPELERMKARRGTFTAAQLERVAAYCHSECDLLVELMDRLAAACEHAACTPTGNWIGAGAIASRLLNKYQVKAHHRYDQELASDELVQRYILGGYYGGRVEMLAQGIAPIVHCVDIRSAYPYAATLLPSLRDGEMVRVNRYDRRTQHAIWRVSWRNQEHNGICPFPVRQEDFTIIYPRSGTGAYHACEVEAALACGYRITVHDGIRLHRRHKNDHPFEWVPWLYQTREEYKRAGLAAEKALKLGLNSVYGKLAQGYGFGGRPPRHQSYFWAGQITARTRAHMLQLLHEVRYPLMVSTDGVFSADPSSKRRVPDTSALGGYERSEMREAFIAQAGVYSYECPACRGAVAARNGTDASAGGTCLQCGGLGMLVKSRGFAAKDVDYHALMDLWLHDGIDGVYEYTSRRFIGLRVALARGKLREVWRTWPDERRTITLNPTRKLIPDISNGIMLRLAPLDGPIESMPYKPKTDLYDDPTDELMELMLQDDQPNLD